MLSGIDYYSGNGSPSLSGLQFAFIKATEGLHEVDSAYAAQRARIRASGLAFGAYHFGWQTEDVDDQAEHFVDVAAPSAGDILFIDFEGYPDGRNWGGLSWAQRDAWRLAWIARVRALTHGMCRVGTYIDTSNWHAIPSSDPGDFLFIAQYGGVAPSISASWQFWQDGDSPVDRDRGNFPTRAALDAWRHGTTPTTTEDTMAITEADARTVWAAPLAENVPAPAPSHAAETYLVDIYQSTALGRQGVGAAVQTLTAHVGALTATMSALAASVRTAGGLTAEQITAAAQAGAAAALAEVGQALTGGAAPAAVS